MDLDLSALWSWTVPLWGLFVLVLFLGGVLLVPTVLEAVPVSVPVPVAAMTGGARSKKQVRWAPDV
jgi:hypothetical protein